jgi:hypothetical protein
MQCKKIVGNFLYISLITPEGFEFPMAVTNAPNLTFISGEGWKEYSRVNQLEVEQEIHYTILKMMCLTVWSVDISP